MKLLLILICFSLLSCSTDKNAPIKNGWIIQGVYEDIYYIDRIDAYPILSNTTFVYCKDNSGNECIVPMHRIKYIRRLKSKETFKDIPK